MVQLVVMNGNGEEGGEYKERFLTVRRFIHFFISFFCRSNWLPED